MQVKSSHIATTYRKKTLSISWNNTYTITNFTNFSHLISKWPTWKKWLMSQNRFFTKISASAVKVTTSINDTKNKNFDQRNNTLSEIDTIVNENKTLAETNRGENRNYKFKVRKIFHKKNWAVRRIHWWEN